MGIGSINNNVAVIYNDASKSDRTSEQTATKENSKSTKKSKGNSIYAGDLNLAEDDILMKKIEAQKKALKTILETFKQESKLDSNMNALDERISELEKESVKAMEERDKILAEKDQLKEDLGIADNSQEQQDLELLEKKNSGSEDLTDEELERLNNMGPLTEYQKTALEYDSIAKEWQKRSDAAVEVIKIQQNTKTAVKLERLKSDPMVDAKKTAEEILEEASEEVVGMLTDEAKDHVDEVVKENNEKIEENQEKKAEQQAEKLKAELEDKMEEILREKLQDKTDGNNEEKEKHATEEYLAMNYGSDLINKATDMSKLQRADNDQKKLQSDIKIIMVEQKLLEDDLKGVEVDEKI